MSWTVIKNIFPVDMWIIDKIKLERNMRCWCSENISNGRWYIGVRGAEFESEQDAIRFSLMWL